MLNTCLERTSSCAKPSTANALAVRIAFKPGSNSLVTEENLPGTQAHSSKCLLVITCQGSSTRIIRTCPNFGAHHLIPWPQQRTALSQIPGRSFIKARHLHFSTKRRLGFREPSTPPRGLIRIWRRAWTEVVFFFWPGKEKGKETKTNFRPLAAEFP